MPRHKNISASHVPSGWSAAVSMIASRIPVEMNHIKQTSDENDVFLFTSESVGEGHPGKFLAEACLD